MKALMAINKKGYIGLNDSLPWKCSEDLKHFKSMTMGKKLLVGRKTAATLPPLKGRTLIVVSSNHHSLEEALQFQPDWVIGGKTLYESTLHLCDELHLSIINDYTNGDIMSPDLRKFTGKIIIYEFET